MAFPKPFLHRTIRKFASRAWKPLVFPSTGFARIRPEQRVDEETIPQYVASDYYPVRVGDVFQDRYQVVGKLGYGTTSTVWLARDLSACRHVALKVFLHSEAMWNKVDAELNIYKRVARAPDDCIGRFFIRPLLDNFNIDGPMGRHQCLVHQPLWKSVHDLRHCNPVRRLPEVMMANLLLRIFLALDFLHTECHVAHTDIKEHNMLIGADSSIFHSFEEEELAQPCPRKEVDGRTIYEYRELNNFPKEYGQPALCDLGSAVALDDGVEHREDIQPNIYRAPEVILGVPWSYSVDVWNVGCVIWDAFEGESLFSGRDPEHKKYRGRAHLAEMMALLGPPPASLLARANHRAKFFDEAGNFHAGIPLPESKPLEQRETTLAGDGKTEDRELFLRFMRKMLQWEPEKRSSARELVEDEWIVKNTMDE
ncbi:kinase-like domain-containing protein [Phyllosticta capitalensis]